MINPNNRQITIVRGDDVTIPVYINKGTKTEPERYILTANDRVEFLVRDYVCGSTPKITVTVNGPQQQVESEYTDIEFVLPHTETIKLCDKNYLYTIKLITTVNNVETIKTLIPNTTLEVIE